MLDNMVYFLDVLNAMKEIIEQKLKIPADYQYRALHNGNFFQKQWHRNRLLLINQLNFLSMHDRVADVGCGSGNTVLTYASEVKSITGFDYNIESVDYLNKKIECAEIKNATAVQLDITDGIQK